MVKQYISVVKLVNFDKLNDEYTVFLPYLSHQRDSTVPHYTVCDRILKKYYRDIYRYFLPRYTNRYIKL